jgi:hypothetical protein
VDARHSMGWWGYREAYRIIKKIRRLRHHKPNIPEFEEVHVLITPEQQQKQKHLENFEAKPTGSSEKESERARERERERETERD